MTRSLLIAGAQKSSSTSLAELLGRHPLVSMAPREVVGLEDPYYPDRLGEVLAHVEGSTALGVVPALKRPELLYREESVDRIRQHLPNPVVVVVLREPVARTLSAYYHYLRHGLLPAVDPSVGIDALLDEFDEHGKESISTRSQVIGYSLYFHPVDQLRKAFGHSLLVFFQEEVHAETSACTSAILRMLEIEPSDLGALPRANAGDYSLRRLRPSRLGGRIGYEVDERGRFFVTTRPVHRLAGQTLFALDRLCSPASTPPPKLDPAVRRRLVSVLASDARRLPESLGRPLPDAWAASLAL